MKRSLKSLIAAIFVCAAAVATAPVCWAQNPAANPAQSEINIDFFYNQLQSDGDWLQTPEYGYVFQPRVAHEKKDWRPYTDGYWSQSDQGWLWNSNENFGWATYHYGRWAQMKDYGWVWVPGYDWAPAWVAWRGTSEDGAVARTGHRHRSTARVSYIGWAPLPPQATWNAGVGFNAAVDYQYGLGPSDYYFVPTAYFGSPYLYPYIVPSYAVYPFWGFTFGFTNIAYTNFWWGGGVYVGGPSYAYLNGASVRPVPYYQIQRVTNVNNFGANLRTPRATNGVMPAFTPNVARTTAANATTAPAAVKTSVAAGQFQRASKVTQASPAAVARAQALVKSQAATAAPAKAPASVTATNTATGNTRVTDPRGQLSPENAAKVQAAQANRASTANHIAGQNATGIRQTGNRTASVTAGTTNHVNAARATNHARTGVTSHHTRMASRSYAHTGTRSPARSNSTAARRAPRPGPHS